MISLKIILAVSLFLFNYVLPIDFKFPTLPIVEKFLVDPAPYDNRIIEGHAAKIEHYPHHVSFNDPIFCGGFIISNNYILAGSHCVQNKEPAVIRVGKNTVIPIAKVIPHPEYNNSAFDKDVAVMRTVDPIKFTDTIQPVSLPPRGKKLITDSIVSVSGWDTTRNTAASIPENLRAVEIPVISHETCKRAYGDVLTTDNVWCGGNFYLGGKEPCQADSGGVAVQDGMAVGIMLFGRICGQPLAPSVFVHIASPPIRDFIANMTGL